MNEADLTRFNREIRLYEGALNRYSNFQGKEELTAMVKKTRSKYYEVYLHRNLKMMKEEGESIRASRAAGDYDKMCEDLAKFVKATQNFKSFNQRYSPYIEKQDCPFGLSFKELGELILEKYQVILEDSMNTARRCMTCMNVAVRGSEEFESMVYTHKPDFSVTSSYGALDRLPCVSCRDCFTKTLDYASSIGQPHLRCPAIGCGQNMDENWVKENAPE